MERECVENVLLSFTYPQSLAFFNGANEKFNSAKNKKLNHLILKGRLLDVAEKATYYIYAHVKYEVRGIVGKIVDETAKLKKFYRSEEDEKNVGLISKTFLSKNTYYDEKVLRDKLGEGYATIIPLRRNFVKFEEPIYFDELNKFMNNLGQNFRPSEVKYMDDKSGYKLLADFLKTVK